VYDAWLELRRSAILDDAGQFGAVRVRYRVEWYSEQRRLLRYLATPPEYLIQLPFEFAEQANFTLNGLDSDSDENYSLNLLMAHAYEVKDGCKAWVYGLIDGITFVIIYEHRLCSIVAAILWQLVCIYPPLLSSCIPLALLSLLAHTHTLAQAKRTGVSALPGFWSNFLNLLLPRPISSSRNLSPSSPQSLLGNHLQLLTEATESVTRQRSGWSAPKTHSGGRQRRLTAVSDDEATPTTPRPTAPTQKDVVRGREEKAKAKAKQMSEAAAELEALNKALEAERKFQEIKKATLEAAKDVGKMGESLLKTTQDTLGQAGDKLQEGKVLTATTSLVTNTVGIGASVIHSAAQTGVNVVRETVRTGASKVAHAGDQSVTDRLLEPYLGWLQQRLGQAAASLRSARALFLWADPNRTMWLTLLLAFLTLTLPLLPWLYIWHVAGLVLLGPQNWFLCRSKRQASINAKNKSLETLGLTWMRFEERPKYGVELHTDKSRPRTPLHAVRQSTIARLDFGSAPANAESQEERVAANASLAKALSNKGKEEVIFFTEDEWQRLGLPSLCSLRIFHYVRCEDVYFMPAHTPGLLSEALKSCSSDSDRRKILCKELERLRVRRIRGGEGAPLQ